MGDYCLVTDIDSRGSTRSGHESDERDVRMERANQHANAVMLACAYDYHDGVEPSAIASISNRMELATGSQLQRLCRELDMRYVRTNFQ